MCRWMTSPFINKSLLYLILISESLPHWYTDKGIMLGLAPHGMELGFLGFGLLGLGLGLGPHLYFMSSFNFETTRRKNFKCEGECPLPSLIKASFIWFSSYSSSWREFVHEFWIPAYNKVSLLLQEKVEEKEKHDLSCGI